MRCIVKGKLKMEQHKGSLFPVTDRQATSGNKAGTRKEWDCKREQEKKTPPPAQKMKWELGGRRVQLKMAVGAPAPARTLTISSVCFV